MTRHITCRVTPAEAGTTLLDHLARRFTYLNREAWLARITLGRVLADNLPATPDLPLVAGLTLCHDASDLPEPPVNTNIQILHDAPNFFAVNKPANLPCHPAGRYFNNTLWAILKKTEGKRQKAETNTDKHASPFCLLPSAFCLIINRLDRETSGVCLIARDPATAARFNNFFKNQTVRKTYLAIVHGHFPETLETTGHLEPDPHSVIRKKLRFIPCGDLENDNRCLSKFSNKNIPLGMYLSVEKTDKNIPLGMYLSVEKTDNKIFASRRDASLGTERRIPTGCETGGCVFLPRETSLTGCQICKSPNPQIPKSLNLQIAVTHFRLLSHHDGLSLIEAIPVTGRTHQIRATLHSLGFPLLGDKLYGLDETLFLRHAAGTLTPADHALLQLPRQALHAHTLQLPLDPPLTLHAPLPDDMKSFKFQQGSFKFQVEVKKLATCNFP